MSFREKNQEQLSSLDQASKILSGVQETAKRFTATTDRLLDRLDAVESKASRIEKKMERLHAAHEKMQTAHSEGYDAMQSKQKDIEKKMEEHLKKQLKILQDLENEAVRIMKMTETAVRKEFEHLQALTKSATRSCKTAVSDLITKTHGASKRAKGLKQDISQARYVAKEAQEHIATRVWQRLGAMITVALLTAIVTTTLLGTSVAQRVAPDLLLTPEQKKKLEWYSRYTKTWRAMTEREQKTSKEIYERAWDRVQPKE